jgi:hypothetical protein
MIRLCLNILIPVLFVPRLSTALVIILIVIVFVLLISTLLTTLVIIAVLLILAVAICRGVALLTIIIGTTRVLVKIAKIEYFGFTYDSS